MRLLNKINAIYNEILGSLLNAFIKNKTLFRDLHEGAVLLNLKKRFDRNLIYVSQMQSLLHKEFICFFMTKSYPCVSLELRIMYFDHRLKVFKTNIKTLLFCKYFSTKSFG